MGALGISEAAFAWQSPYGNTCTFPNSNLTCSFVSFNTSTLVAQISLTNKLAVPAKLNTISCAQVIGLSSNQTINTTVAAGASSTSRCSAPTYRQRSWQYRTSTPWS